jgi:hypothetical protein
MIHITLHLRGHQAKATALPALPPVGAYISHEGQLWRIIDIVFGKAVNLYCIAISTITTSELEAAWASWDEGVCQTEARQ